jgi:membrane-bound metal-dependent hydrolase YbcI (DUF457 family)
MPTPLAHGVAAWATAKSADPGDLRGPRLFALVAFLAVVPDLDFLPGFLLDYPDAFHRGPTHSVVGAALASAAIAWVLALLSARRGRDARGFGGWLGLVMPMYYAHILLDLLVPDHNGATGMRLFWPFSDAFIGTPMPMPAGLRAFIDLGIGTESGSFVGALLSWHGLAVFVVEGLLFTPLLLAPKLMGSARRRVSGLSMGPAAREQPEA